MTFIIFALTLRGEKVQLDLNDNATLGDAKVAIAAALAASGNPIPVTSQRLLFNGRELVDDNAPLASHGVKKGSIVHVVARLPGADDRARDIAGQSQRQQQQQGPPPPAQHYGQGMQGGMSPYTPQQQQQQAQVHPYPQGFYPPAVIGMPGSLNIPLLTTMWRAWCVMILIALFFSMLAATTASRRGIITVTPINQTAVASGAIEYDFGYSKVTIKYEGKAEEKVSIGDIDTKMGSAGDALGAFMFVSVVFLAGAVFMMMKLLRRTTPRPARTHSWALILVSVTFLGEVITAGTYTGRVYNWADDNGFTATNGPVLFYIYVSELMYIIIAVTSCIQCMRGDACRVPEEATEFDDGVIGGGGGGGGGGGVLYHPGQQQHMHHHHQRPPPPQQQQWNQNAAQHV